jgi:DnaJ-domain-containing protein 1
MALGGYYMPFHWPFLHVCLLGLVFGTADYKLLLPVGVLLTLLYFFPRSVLSLVALIVLWMLWPIVAAARQQIGLLIEQPYGPAFLDEDAKKAKEKAETPITDEARRLFERYGLGTASAPDLPNRIWQAFTELGLKRSQSEASGLLGEYEGGRAGRLSAEEFLQLVAAEVALAGKTHYDVLRTHRAAMPAELKKGYRRMSLLLHPDKNARESAARAFKRVSDAYTTLSDAYTRAEYDANLDDGGTGEDGLEGGGEAAQAPSFSPDMPSGPPGLKKRKGRPPRR